MEIEIRAIGGENLGKFSFLFFLVDTRDRTDIKIKFSVSGIHDAIPREFPVSGNRNFFGAIPDTHLISDEGKICIKILLLDYFYKLKIKLIL